jgi:hypothetical protein
MKKLIALVAALVMFSSMAYATDWNFYGSSRLKTWWSTTDANTAGTPDVDGYQQAMQGNARFGANVKVSDELTAGFEYGTGVNLRILYGEWNFGAGSLLIGQTYSPLCMFYSNQVFGDDGDLLAQGGVYSGREPMLRLKFGDFQIAAIAPKTAVIKQGTYADGTSSPVATTPSNGDAVVYHDENDDLDIIESTLPAIEASYSLNLDPFSLKIAGGYQTYEASNKTTHYSVDVDSYVLAIGGKVNFGMAYLAGNYYTGQNVGSLILIDYNGSTTAPNGLASASTNNTLDRESTGYIIVGGAKINDMFAVEAGYGCVTSDLDGSSTDDDASSYYLQATINLAPGVSITPEYGVIDYEENGQNEITYFGAKWQINF